MPSIVEQECMSNLFSFSIKVSTPLLVRGFTCAVEWFKKQQIIIWNGR